MKIRNGLLIVVIGLAPTTTMIAKKKIVKPIKQPAGPISGPNPYRSVITCPVCPNFICTGPTGTTGISGCTGPACTGTCRPNLIAEFCCLNISQSETIRGSITANTEEISGNLGVSGNADFKSDLIVQGNGNLQGNACIGGDLNVNDNVSIGGFEVILGSLTVNSSVTIDRSLVINADQTINGNLTVTGNSDIGGDLTVRCVATFAGLLTGNGGATGAGPSLNVFNGSIINNGLIILNTGCTAPTGPDFCTGIIANGNMCIVGNEMITGDLTVNRELTIDNNATFNGTFNTTGTLITNSIVTINDGITIENGDEIITAGDLNLIASTGILEVGGQTIFQGTVSANNGAIINNGLTVENGQTVPIGNYNVPQGSVTVEGSITVGGTITSNTGQSQLNGLTITSTENALCSTGPAALVVNGGVGIAKDLWKENCEFFANVEAEGGTPGCLEYYEESSYTTSFIWGGLTVNPPISATIRIVRVGNIVNLYIPEIIYNNPGVHIDVITSTNPLPARFRPSSTIRGASSTIIYNDINDEDLVGVLGEYDISPAGTITFGLAGPDALGPQRIVSDGLVYVDINSITYNINDSTRTCKRCAG